MLGKCALAAACSPVKARAATARCYQAIGDLEQIGVGVEEVSPIVARQRLVIRRRFATGYAAGLFEHLAQGTLPLSRITSLQVRAGARKAFDLVRPEILEFCEFRTPCRADQPRLDQCIKHALPNRPRRRRHFDDQIETTQECGIEVADLIGDPDRRHRIGLQHPIDPALLQSVTALEEPCKHRRREQVLCFVENHQRLGVQAQRLLAQLQGFEPRVAIARLAVSVHQGHLKRGRVRLLRQQVGPAVEIYFLMGMDSLRDLPKWYDPAWLVENCTLVALSRHDVELDWEKLNAALPGIRDRVIILDMPELEIASHAIQARVRDGQPIRHQVPRAVEAYIYKHGLYRE